jgi:hypothetical protein
MERERAAQKRRRRSEAKRTLELLVEFRFRFLEDLVGVEIELDGGGLVARNH